jgi:rRNA maturation endonuclease Nob1
MVLCDLNVEHRGKRDRILVLDTSAILSGFSSHLADARQFTTPNVLDELPKNKVNSNTQIPLLSEASIEVVAPSEGYLMKVEETVKAIGEMSVSTTDKSLIALSLQLKDAGQRPVLVSDDYALQNLAEISNVDYLPYVEKGIHDRYSWKLVCPACFREYPPLSELEACPICGTTLKKRNRKHERGKRS